jgi:Potential Queuosine, Q, salvage protein family
MQLLCLQVDSQQRLPAGSEMEIEIRACTIAAVEMLRGALDARLQSANTAASLGSESTAAASSPLGNAVGMTGAAAASSSPAATAMIPAAVAKSAWSAGDGDLDSRNGALEQCSQGVTAVAVDWWLWGKGEAQRDTAPPHHRTLTIYY